MFVEAGIKYKEQQKLKDKFIPKTPLNLYNSSNKLLKDYLNNNFINDKEIYNELLLDILSLLYYFKIPVIGEKWIEHYKIQEEKTNVAKTIHSEKNIRKREASNADIEELDINELNEVIKEIIAILIDLFQLIKTNKKKNLLI